MTKCKIAIKILYYIPRYCIKHLGGVKMKNKVVKKIVSLVNFSLKVDANSTSTVFAFQPKVPQKLNTFKKK